MNTSFDNIVYNEYAIDSKKSLKPIKDRALMNVEYWCKKNIKHYGERPDVKIKHVNGIYEIHGHDIELVTREVLLPFRIIPRNSLIIKAKSLKSFDNLCYYNYNGQIAHSATIRHPHIVFSGASQLNFLDLYTNMLMDFSFTNSLKINPQSLIHMAFDNIYFDNCKSPYIHDLSHFIDLIACHVYVEPLTQITNVAHLLLSNISNFSFNSTKNNKSIYTYDELFILNACLEKYFNAINRKELLMDMTLELSDRGFDRII